MHIVHCALCTLYNVHCTMYNVQCTMYDVHCTFQTMKIIFYMPIVYLSSNYCLVGEDKTRWRRKEHQEEEQEEMQEGRIISSSAEFRVKEGETVIFPCHTVFQGNIIPLSYSVPR